MLEASFEWFCFGPYTYEIYFLHYKGLQHAKTKLFGSRVCGLRGRPYSPNRFG